MTELRTRLDHYIPIETEKTVPPSNSNLIFTAFLEANMIMPQSETIISIFTLNKMLGSILQDPEITCDELIFSLDQDQLEKLKVYMQRGHQAFGVRQKPTDMDQRLLNGFVESLLFSITKLRKVLRDVSSAESKSVLMKNFAPTYSERIFLQNVLEELNRENEEIGLILQNIHLLLNVIVNEVRSNPEVKMSLKTYRSKISTREVVQNIEANDNVIQTFDHIAGIIINSEPSIPLRIKLALIRSVF